MYALGVVVRNVRIAESFEVSQAEAARRATVGDPRQRRRRRRHQRDELVHDEPAPNNPPALPG